MKGLATLRTGGLSLQRPLFTAPQEAVRKSVLPPVAVFPLLQHAGTPAERLVDVGARVREGQEIGRTTGPISAVVHSSIPGVVVDTRSLRLANGEWSEAAIVRLEGEFERLGKKQANRRDFDRPQDDALLECLREKGVVSMDGNAVPLHVLWKLPRGKRADRLIVSAINNEPFLVVEHLLSVEQSEALAEGLAVALAVLHPRTVDFVSEEAVDEGTNRVVGLIESVAREAGVEFSHSVAGATYPRGEERELAHLVGGQRLAQSESLIDRGIFVANTSTLIAVRDAVVEGKPLIERYVAVGGGAVAGGGVFRVRIGTRICDLLEECGGFVEVPERVVVGGALTGSVVYDLDLPIMKNTAAVLVFTEREAGAREGEPCINCGRCLTVCPEGLNPTRLFKEIDHGRYEKAVKVGLTNCSECGSCSFVCPSRIPLLAGLRKGKQILAERGE